MKKNFLHVIVAAIAAAFMLTSCGTYESFTRSSQYPKMYEEHPLTLLVMPPINNTTNVEAKEYLFTSISRPIVECGYYVIPPMLSMEVMKAESAYDAELFYGGDQAIFRRIFGADAVIYTEILTWAKQGFSVVTKLHYVIKSTVTNEIIFDRTCDLRIDTSVNSGGNSLLGSLVNLAASAINTAATQHIEAARRANYYVVRDMPRGKYDANYQLDQQTPASNKDIKVTVQ